MARAGVAVYVSPTGQADGAGTSCGTARYAVIQQAVVAAAAGSTVVVCEGTYTMASQGVEPDKPFIEIAKRLTLRGEGAVLDASRSSTTAGASVGIWIRHSNVTVTGFTVTGAMGEGILAEPAWRGDGYWNVLSGKPATPIIGITIADTRVYQNDQGAIDHAPFDYCRYGAPFYCGGGIHLNTVASSTVHDNRVTGNADGILLSDAGGPTRGDVISGNRVLRNRLGSGIVLNAESAGLIAASAQTRQDTYWGLSSATGKVYPTRGGVYDNLIVNNVVADNGTRVNRSFGHDGGAGILLTASYEGNALYRNEVRHNVVFGNGWAGVDLHIPWCCFGGEYPAGARIVDNTIGTNNLVSDSSDPHGASLTETVGIALLSAAKTTVDLRGNHISSDTVGVWRTPTVKLHALANSFRDTSHHYSATQAPVVALFHCGLYSYGDPTNCDETDTRITFVALLIPNGSRTHYYFKYGTNPTSLTHKTPVANAGSALRPVLVRATVDGLDTTSNSYYVRLVAWNSHGTASTHEQGVATQDSA